MRHLKLFFASMLMVVLSIGQMWGADVVVTLDNIGAGLGSTANATVATTNITATGTTDSYTLNYYQCKKQSNAMLLTKKASPYISNKTAMPGNIKSVEVFINSGAAGKTTYDCAFSTTEVTNATAGIGAVNITGGNSNTFSNLKTGGAINVEGKYFCITLGNDNNGQVLKLVITCEGSGGDSSAPTLSSISISGTPNKTTYEAGENFDPSGLVATGTYSDASTSPIASGITWTACKTESGTYVALDNAAVALAKDETDIYVKATVSKETSAAFHVTGLTVTEAPAADNYELVTDVSDLEDAAEIIIVNIDENKALSTNQQTNNRAGVAVSSTNHVIPVGSDVQIITLEASSSNWKFKVGTDSYLYASSGSANQLKTTTATTAGDNGVWAIAIADDGAATIIAQGSNTRNNLRYNPNNGSPIFCCYSSTSTMGLVKIFKKSDGTSKQAAGLAYDAADAEKSVVLGETFTAPTLTNPHSLTVSYESDNTAVAEVASNGSVTIKATGKAVITASFAGNDDYKSGSASYTIIVTNHAGTAADPYSVADARTVIDAGIGLADKYVRGIVSEIVEPLNTTYHNISYNFSDDGLTTSAQLEAYRGKSYNGDNFTSEDDIQVGDDVIVFGTLKKYGSTYELDAGNQLVKRSAHLAWSGTTEGAYAASLEGGNTFPTLTNSDNVSVSYSSSETSVATINASNGNIDLVGAGSTNITATFTGNDTYFEKSASYTLNVSSTVIKADILFEENGGSAVTDMQAQSNLPSPLPTTTKAGYNFGGWFMDSEFNTSAVAGAAVTSSDPITLYAKWLDPYSVGVALTMINALADNEKTDNVYVIGVVDNHATSLSSTSINYNIKDANASNTLAVYKGKGLKTDLAPTGEDVTSADYVQEGDQVVVYGQLYKYVDKNSNTTPEIAQGSYMFSKVRPAVAVTGIDLTESTAEVEVGSTVTLHASVVPGNATNKTINWTVESGSDKASVQDGVVSGLAVGTAVIRAASDEDATIYAECTVTVTAADPTKHVVTFDATVDTEIFTKDNITMSCPNGALSNGSEYRLYKNSETTFECSAGNITKIEFTGVSGNPVSGFEDPAEGTLETSGNDGVWTGNVASVTFTASGAQVRASLIKVTYKEDTRAESGLAWDPADDIELTVGDAFTAPTLTNPHSLTVSITSDNTDLATVTAGVVALVADATGEATITATFAGNDDYKPATVSYKITVNGGALTDYYEKVTSGAVAEGTYLIVYETTSVAFDGSLETLDATSNTIDVTITNDHKIAVTQATAASTFYIDPTAGTIKSASGKYIGRTAISNGMNTSATEAFTNTISIDNDGNAVIVGSGTTATYLRYNLSSGQTRFRYFTQNQQAIQLYKLANEVIKPAAGLAWDPADDIELTVGETFTAPTLQNPNNIATNEISITSSNTNLATVNNGIVELVADATGTTTIKATFAGNDDYKAAEVSYKIKVNPLSSIVVTPSLKVNFGSVEQGATLPDNQAITVTLTNVAAGTATLGGTNPEAFGIDKTALVEGDNVINISVASTATAGDFKATIVITDNATENPAASKTVNISLKVTEPAAEETPVSTTSKWVAATAADLVDGKEVLITGAKEGTVYAMGEQKTNNRAAVAGTLDEGVFTPGENSMSVTLVDQGNNTFALMTSDGQYLYAASSSANQLKKRTAIGDDNNAIWTVAVDALTANGSNRGVMQFNYSATNQLFSCYASASSSYIAIALYVPQTTPPTPTYTEIRTGLQSGRYYSLCYPKKMTAIKGGTLWSFAGKEADMAYLEQAEAPYAAGQPYFIYAESDKFEAVLEGDATSTAGNNNGLYGTLVDMTNSDLLAAGATYLLKNNELHPLGEAYLSAYKAYVIVENINGGKPAATSGKQVRSMPLHVDTTTGLDELNTSETPTKVIINGQLFIIRGEKMFDATGRLVK